MKKCLIVSLCLVAQMCYAQQIDEKQVWQGVEKQTEQLLTAIPLAKNGNNNLVSPRSLDSKGNLVLTPAVKWISGFFPGELWYLYEYTGNPHWQQMARTYTANIEKEKYNGGTHDMGFKIYCSFGNGYRLTKDEAYKAVIIKAAQTLSTRFNPTVGCIRSWDTMPKWSYPVIIDNMLNLELLFAATKLTGDSSFFKIAVSHANTTLNNHFRKDYSCYHVLDYDSTQSGVVIKKTTHQGFADESAWARGQAWALYGFTMCYRETKNPQYLKQAEKVADYIFSHPNLPEDLIPYWDFNAPNIPNEPRDASAAACMASGLYELATFSKKGKHYRSIANKIIENLTNKYRSPLGENKGFILLHSTGSKPFNSEVDVPLCYADYYYLEALLRSKQMKK